MNFDRVILKTPEGDRSMSADEFTKIPITERVRLVSKGLVEFFRNGQPVRATEAFRQRGA